MSPFRLFNRPDHAPPEERAAWYGAADHPRLIDRRIPVRTRAVGRAPARQAPVSEWGAGLAGDATSSGVERSLC